MDMLDPVESLKGIGEKTAASLKKAGIKTVRDFFYTLPRDYEDFQSVTSIQDIRPGKIVIKGKIDSIVTRQTRRRNLSITEGVIRDGTGAIRVVWFNQSFRKQQLDSKKEYFFIGEYSLKNGRFSLHSPRVAGVIDTVSPDGLSPIYVAHGAIHSQSFHRLVNNLRDKFALIPDLLPEATPGARQNALFDAHFPTSTKIAAAARDYLAYEELFSLILAARLNRRENDKLVATSVPFQVDKVRELVGKLPFKLTNAQRLAAWEIYQDMEKPTPMNRLLQGDVGSGKTMVAALAAFGAATAHGQVALLAPTAILAAQHYEKLSRLLADFGLKTALLTGATKQKTDLKKSIKSGDIDVVIGTHALLTDDTEFQNLTLAIIDEQHRFGVAQRQKLALKSPAGKAPHLLTMTATPIPRSLQLTVFGDLSVSILNELPKGRQPITTKILPEVMSREKLYPAMQKILARRQQIYWICKAIDDAGAELSAKFYDKKSKSSERDKAQPAKPTSEITSVKTRARRLAELFPRHKVEFLHGKMKPQEKDDIMTRFASGDIDILVSTTVVEVGVDVPNANLMIIENAETYGLAQLHQLRGRVGRGQAPGYCALLTAGDASPSRRLRELEKSTDGFYLSEVDLKLRGPGEIYGALQHGALDLRIATLADTKLIHKASQDVDKFLQNPENLLNCKELMASIKKYQQITTLN